MPVYLQTVSAEKQLEIQRRIVSVKKLPCALVFGINQADGLQHLVNAGIWQSGKPSRCAASKHRRNLYQDVCVKYAMVLEQCFVGYQIMR